MLLNMLVTVYIVNLWFWHLFCTALYCVTSVPAILKGSLLETALMCSISGKLGQLNKNWQFSYLITWIFLNVACMSSGLNKQTPCCIVVISIYRSCFVKFTVAYNHIYRVWLKNDPTLKMWLLSNAWEFFCQILYTCLRCCFCLKLLLA